MILYGMVLHSKVWLATQNIVFPYMKVKTFLHLNINHANWYRFIKHVLGRKKKLYSKSKLSALKCKKTSTRSVVLR